jgi:hypothetical protein
MLSCRRSFVVLVGLIFLSGGKLSADPPVGWRMNGSGRYPDANPPTEWSQENNVDWKTKLPGRSYGSPIVVGDRVFVVSDPEELLCIRAADGAALWQKTSGHVELLGTEKAEDVLAMYKAIREQSNALRREYGELRKIEDTPKEKLDELRAAIDAVKQQEKDLATRYPPPSNGGGAGNSAATPVSNGKLVFTVYATGIVSAHSLDGERRWITFVDGANIGFGHASSPVLVDGKLIVHIKDLVALDAANGKELWRVELRARHATPIVARVGGENVIVDPSGSVVRISDGTVLAEQRELSVSEASVVTHGGVLFAQSGKTSALRLPQSIGESFALELLWEGKASRGRRTPSPVYHEGLLYGVTTDGIMDVTDAESGKTVYQKRLDIGKVYSSITVAGDFLYLCSTKGTTIVLEPGRKYQEIARNELESLGSCPVFAGKRMYVRARTHLYCIQRGG